jgi:YidC/Oxa1 family membrane protein insertase
MDFQRIILFAGIAAISFLLLQEWMPFKEQYKLQQSISSNSNTQQNQPASPVSDLPASTPVNSEHDVPHLVEPSAAPAVLADSTSDQLIEIETDVLKLKIDKVGGDIVYVALPKHFAHIDTPDIPFTLMETEKRLYIAQSGLVGPNGTDTNEGRPSFNSSSDVYQLAPQQQELIVDLTLPEKDGISITKRYSLHRSDYLIEVEYLINNQSNAAWKAVFYGQIKRDSSQDPAAESGSGMGVQPFLGVATTTAEERFLKIDFDDMAEKNFSNTSQGGWIAMLQHYFVTAWIPEANQQNTFSTLVTSAKHNIARFTGPQTVIPAKQEGIIKAGFYAGPKDQYRLEEIAQGLDLSVDYGWLWWIAQPLFALLNFFFTLTGNWGWAIILLTILVKVAFFYPSAISYRSMAKMRKIQPKMLSIRELHPDDRQKQSQEMMALYKKEGVNPLGGCLPIVIQMPVFIALYWVLLESVELRHAPFIGYIKDLSAMDPYFFLPLVMGVSMFFQQKLNPPPPDPMQAKVMQWLPVIFTFFFLWFPSGLVLYWVVNNILSIIQQYVITKQIEAAD